MTQNRTRYFLKNTAIFTIGTFASKLISFFLVPLYTNMLSTAEYGTVDLVNTVCTVLAPVLILDIADSILRFSLDKGADHNKILSIGVVCLLCGVAAGILIFPVSGIFLSTASYSEYIYFYSISIAASSVFMAYLRGTERLELYTIGNFIQTFLAAVFNILFLTVFHLGVKGYFLAFTFSYLYAAIFAFISGKCYRVFKRFKFDRTLLISMVRYSILLIPHTFMWWIINSSDRIMVSAMVGIDANGLYGVSYKLPSIVSIVSYVVNQAWGYSAVRENESSDRNDFSSKMYSYLLAASVLSAVALMLIMKPFMHIYVEESYYEAWKYTPFLLIGNVFMTLGSFMGTSYYVNKDSKSYLYSGIYGAVTNIILNLIFIKLFGVAGAALSTCISFFVVFIYTTFDKKNNASINIWSFRNIISFVIMILAGASMFIYGWLCYLALGLELTVLIIIFKKEIFEIFRRVLKK